MTKLEERLDWNKIYETERDSQRERERERLAKQLRS